MVVYQKLSHFRFEGGLGGFFLVDSKCQHFEIFECKHFDTATEPATEWLTRAVTYTVWMPWTQGWFTPSPRERVSDLLSLSDHVQLKMSALFMSGILQLIFSDLSLPWVIWNRGKSQNAKLWVKRNICKVKTQCLFHPACGIVQLLFNSLFRHQRCRNNKFLFQVKSIVEDWTEHLKVKLGEWVKTQASKFVSHVCKKETYKRKRKLKYT